MTRASRQCWSMVSSVECVVVGAGVIGLAVARALAVAGRDVLVLDKNQQIGMETSSRNSEVIHAGIYYAQDSFKARLCVEGRDKLYRFCASHGVAHKKTGKLIVASDKAQLAALHDIYQRGFANGVSDLQVISAAEAHSMEPALSCAGAVYSPSTGIIDAHEYILALQGEAEAHGAQIVLRTEVQNIDTAPNGFTLSLGGSEKLNCNMLVNCGGLHAVALAHKISGLSAQFIPEAKFAKGNYFKLMQRSPFTRLIYPVPQPGGLGIHITHDLHGAARFGPDVEWIDNLDYTVATARADAFYEAVRSYWPALPDDALQADYAGIRPKIEIDGVLQNDFMISAAQQHGVAGLINLFGIESPGLTASLAIGNKVAALLSDA